MFTLIKIAYCPPSQNLYTPQKRLPIDSSTVRVLIKGQGTFVKHIKKIILQLKKGLAIIFVVTLSYCEPTQRPKPKEKYEYPRESPAYK